MDLPPAAVIENTSQLQDAIRPAVISHRKLITLQALSICDGAPRPWRTQPADCSDCRNKFEASLVRRKNGMYLSPLKRFNTWLTWQYDLPVKPNGLLF